MPSVNLRKPIYDELIRKGEDPVEFANKAARELLEDEYGETEIA